MYKRIVGEYVKDEIQKGRTIQQIRKRLLKVGYDKKDVDKILRKFEYRESDLKNKADIVKKARLKVHVLLGIALIFFIMGASLSLYYFSNPSYVLVKETPTGLVTETITKEELANLREGRNISDPSVEGLPKIT